MLANPVITSAILGASRPEQLADTLAAADLQLDAGLKTRLDELSAEYRMGDVLIFGMRTVHASLDNQTPFFRFSTDTRYQPASEPIDGRWVGENPIGHGAAAKRGMIC